jgi:hypothetical protein
MGRIQNRTREHLGQSDKAITAYRRLLRQSIEQVEKGERPPIDPAKAAALRGPATMDGIGPSAGWQDYWQSVDRKRRLGAEWARATIAAAE